MLFPERGSSLCLSHLIGLLANCKPLGVLCQEWGQANPAWQNAEMISTTSLTVAVVLLRVVIAILISSPVLYKVKSKVKGLAQDQKVFDFKSQIGLFD